MNDHFFEKLYIEMYESLYSLAFTALRNPDLAQDVVQETFLIAYKKIEAVKASPSPNGWLVKTLRNVLGNTYKQQKKLMQWIVPLSEDTEDPRQTTSLHTEYKGLIDDDSLQLLIQVYCENKTYQEVADELGISLVACKKRIQRAKQQFKIAIEKDNQKFLE